MKFNNKVFINFDPFWFIFHVMHPYYLLWTQLSFYYLYYFMCNIVFFKPIDISGFLQVIGYCWHAAQHLDPKIVWKK